MQPNGGPLNMDNPDELYKSVTNTGFHFIKHTVRASKAAATQKTDSPINWENFVDLS